MIFHPNISARKLAEDCCKYGVDNQCTNSYVARAVLQFGTSHNLMENERETFLGILGDQVNSSLFSISSVFFVVLRQSSHKE